MSHKVIKNTSSVQASRLYLLFCLLFFSMRCQSLPTDKQQTLHFTAGFASINQKTHRGYFRDGVQFSQGTTHLQAFRAIAVTNNKNQLIKAIVYGNKQAHFWTQMSSSQQDFHAYADVIYYYPDKHLLKLCGNASVIQADNVFKAPKISYDLLQQHVLSTRDLTARPTIIVYPKQEV